MNNFLMFLSVMVFVFIIWLAIEKGKPFYDNWKKAKEQKGKPLEVNYVIDN